MPRENCTGQGDWEDSATSRTYLIRSRAWLQNCNSRTAINSTVSQARIMRRLLHERVAARTSVERPGEGDGQSLSHGGDRVLDVALGSNRGRLGVLDDGEGQGLRGAGVLRGERPLSRGSGIHRRRCRAWRGDGILASLVLRNGRGRVRS